MLKQISVAVLLSFMLLGLRNIDTERHINIINPESYPDVGGNWVIDFETSGIGVLEIRILESNSVSYYNMYYKSGSNWVEVQPYIDGDTIKIFWSYKSGRLVLKVLEKGFHTVEFSFGNTAYAHNSAGQAVQEGFVLNISNPVFRYHQSSFDPKSTLTFDVTGSFDEDTTNITLPKNITILSAFMNITGSITYTESPSPGAVYGIKIADVNTTFSGNETVVAIGDVGDNNYIRLLNNTFSQIWQYPSAAISKKLSCVDAADIDTGISGLETVAGDYNGYVHLIANNGTQIWNYSGLLGNYIDDVAAGELNSTYTGLEIVVGANNLTVLNSSGSFVWGINTGTQVKGVAIGDVNDSSGDEVVSVYGSTVAVYNATGSLLWSKVSAAGSLSSLGIGNVSNSGYNEIVLGTSDGYVMILNESQEWVWNYSIGGIVGAVKAGEADTYSSGIEVLAGTTAGRLYCFYSNGTFDWSYEIPGSERVESIDIGNLTVDTSNEVAVGTRSGTEQGHIYVFNFDDFPVDPYLNVNNDSDAEWNYTGKYRTTENITGSAFINELNQAMGLCSADSCNVKVVANSTHTGELRLSGLNITYDYNVSDVITNALQNRWSRTVGINANESIGNQSYNISFPKNPAENLRTDYIAVNAGAASCDFNDTAYNVTTVSSVYVCNITPFAFNLSMSPPSSVLFWDSNMTSGMPIIMNMSQNYYTAPWRYKNITIRNDTSSYAAQSEIFYNITANISFAGQGFTDPIELKVDWYSNGTYYNITPDNLVSNCNTSNPTYSVKTIVSSTFYVCSQDVDGNNIIDFFRWVQPRSYFNSTSMANYMLNGTGNTPPTLTQANVTPTSAIWETVFNFTVMVNDTEGDQVNVTLWYYTEGTGWVKNDTLSINTGIANGTLQWNMTSTKFWTNSSVPNNFVFEYRDPYINWDNTTQYYGPNVLKHNVSVTYVAGNYSSVNRTGTNTTRLIVYIDDLNSTTDVGAANCFINVTTDQSSYTYAGTNQTNTTGSCIMDFNPNNTYHVGPQKWLGGIRSDLYYNNNQTELFYNLTIYGDFNVVFTLTPSSGGNVARYNNSAAYSSNITWDITSVTEDNSSAVSGYNVWQYWRGGLQNGSAYSYGIFDIPDNNPVNESNDIIMLVLGKQYFNNWTSTSADYDVYGRLNYTIEYPPNATQVHRNYGTQNLTMNLTDERYNMLPGASVIWYTPAGACDVTYGASGNYTCTYNPSNTITPGYYLFSANATLDNYTSVANASYSYLWINGSVNVNLTSQTLAATYRRGVNINLTARLIDENGAAVAISNYNCSWYRNNSYVNYSLTNASGMCYMNWTTSCSDQLGGYDWNVTLSGTASEFYAIAYNNSHAVLNLTDILSVTINYPSNDTLVHRTESTWLNATVSDTCYTPPDSSYTLKWYNETTNISDGSAVNFTWTVPTYYVLGYEKLNATATGGNYTSGNDSIWLRIYGWSNVSYLEPDVITIGINDTIVCRVFDDNTTQPISGYNVSFYNVTGTNNFMGWNMTNSTGHATMHWDTMGVTIGNVNVTCNITDNATLFYNRSVPGVWIVVNVSDNTAPQFSDWSVVGTNIEANYEHTTISITVADDTGANNVWVQFNYTNNITLYNITLNESTHMISSWYSYPFYYERWQYNYSAPWGGNYTVSVWANDSYPNHYNSTLNVTPSIGSFFVIGKTNTSVVNDPSFYYAYSITESNYRDQTVFLNVTNTGFATMYNVTVTTSLPSGVTRITNDYNFGNISDGTYKRQGVTFRIFPTADLGNNTIAHNITWENADKSINYTIVNTTFYLENFTVLEVTEPQVIDYILNNTEIYVGNFTIEAFGTTELINVSIYNVTDVPDNWVIEFIPDDNFTGIGKNAEQSVAINVTATVPYLGNSVITYRVNCTGANCTGTNCWDDFTLNITVIGQFWNRTPGSYNFSVGINTTGTLDDIINVWNNADDELHFKVDVSGNATTKGYLNVTNTTFNLSSLGNTYIPFQWNTTGSDSDLNKIFLMNVTINNTDEKLPGVMYTTIWVNITSLYLDINSPTSANQKIDVLAGDTIIINATAQFAGSPIDDTSYTVIWYAEVNGTNCPITGYDFLNPYWQINCTAPDLPGNPIWTDLFLRGNVTQLGGIIEDTSKNSTIFRDITPPWFSAVNVTPIQPQNNMSFTLDVYDNAGIGSVTATIKYPNGTTANQQVTYDAGTKWGGEQLNLTTVGDYWLNITATDIFSLKNSTIGWFDVYTPVFFDGLLDGALGDNVSALFSFYVPDNESFGGLKQLTHQFNTSDSHADFNETLHKRRYDLEVYVYNSTITFDYLNFNVAGSNISDAFTVDYILPENLGLPAETTQHGLYGVYLGSGFAYSTVTLKLNFSGSPQYKNLVGMGWTGKPNLHVYRCSSWNFTGISCPSSWSDIAGSVNILQNTITVTLSSLSAFGVAEPYTPYEPPEEPQEPGGTYYPPSPPTAVCGDGVCGIGENSENCPEDCATLVGLTVETTLSEAYLRPGENKTYYLSIGNTMNEPKSASIRVEGSAADFISFENEFITVPSQSSRTTKIYVIVPGDAVPGAYTGDIVITSEGRVRRIPVTIIVSLEGATQIELALNALTKQISPNDTFKFNLIVYDLGIVKTVPTNFTYSIKDVETESIIVQVKKDVVIESTQSFIESIGIPTNASLGRYFIEVTALYSNRTVSVTDEFEIVQPFWTIERIQMAAVIISAITGTIVAYYSRKRYLQWRAERAKYVFPVSYRSLPGERKEAMWLGRIAETNRKAWFYPELLTTHTLVSGSTGSGKSVTASLIAEEALKQNIPVVVFDPTAQWTGFVKRCQDKSMIDAYPRFGLSPIEAQPFKGMIFEVTDPNVYIDFRKFMNPSEITVFTLNKLKPGEYDTAVWNIVDSIFAVQWEEATELKLLIIFDEVHRLLEKYGGRGGYVALEKAVREFRKWGIGLVMCSQVSSDFKEAIQGNILTEVQMSTKSLTDIKKVENKFGADYARRISKEAVGVGMLQNPKFNRGKPYFIEFRPTLHSPHKLTEAELDMYKNFAMRLSVIDEAIQGKKKKGEDVFDISLEMKLAYDKLKTGSFRMAEIYLESLEKKLGLGGGASA